jgi:hypothetical protein
MDNLLNIYLQPLQHHNKQQECLYLLFQLKYQKMEEKIFQVQFFVSLFFVLPHLLKLQ